MRAGCAGAAGAMVRTWVFTSVRWEPGWALSRGTGPDSSAYGRPLATTGRRAVGAGAGAGAERPPTHRQVWDAWHLERLGGEK